MIDRAVSAKRVSVNSDIYLWKTIYDTVSKLRYLVKIVDALMEMDELLEPVLHVVNTEGDCIMEASSKLGLPLKAVLWATKKIVFVRSSLSSGSCPPHFFHDKPTRGPYPSLF